jgi:CheY-like chemotaxis protein
MLSVVIIDDDEEEFDFMRDAILKSYDDSLCVCFNDAQEALNELRTQSIAAPDFIFLDVNMGRMSGEQCLMQLKQIELLQHTRIVMMSSSIKIYGVKLQRFEEFGAFSVVEKPDRLDKYDDMFKSVIGDVTDDE